MRHDGEVQTVEILLWWTGSLLQLWGLARVARELKGAQLVSEARLARRGHARTELADLREETNRDTRRELDGRRVKHRWEFVAIAVGLGLNAVGSTLATLCPAS